MADTLHRTLARRGVIAAAVSLLAASAAFAQTPPPAPPVVRPQVVLETSQGRVVIELAADKAPVTSANFLRYVDAKRLDGASFYRAMKNAWAPQTGVVQGGLQNDPAKAFPPIKHEATLDTGLSHRDGAVSMARYAPGTATSEFFISVGDNSGLDERPRGDGDIAGFAVFGQVIEGMDVVKAVLAAPTSPTRGEGVMKGQMLEPEVKILTARRATPAG
jgi:peptidyl-prolyl cis-trans isomerase A (cyclophilin A)